MVVALLRCGLIYLIWNGRNWVRLLLLVVGILQILQHLILILVFVVAILAEPLLSLIMVMALGAGLALMVASLTLLFHPESNYWFRRLKEARQTNRIERRRQKTMASPVS